ELCGIAAGVGAFLARHGVERCGEMKKLPISLLGSRYGNPGKRIWLMAQGADPETVDNRVKPPKSIGHGKVIPPNTRDRALIKTYLRHMAYKVAARMRRHQLFASRFLIALRLQHDWLSTKVNTVQATDEEQPIYHLALELLQQVATSEGVFQVQITALNPATTRQRDLFAEEQPRRRESAEAMDAINLRYGDLTLASARLLNRSTMPDVIAPSWKPEGHRRTV
ncbi:MAG: DNA polymerase IV, partial [Gammaproteobacteria bacterium]|nr:DNA polymerase IV [Gammaproteobacteria bacterium]